MYEITIPLFHLIFFKFLGLKSKTFNYLIDKYSFEFLTLSYFKNQNIIIYDEIRKIFPELICKERDIVSDEEFKILGVFSYLYMDKNVRLLILIQEAKKNLNFRFKMKKKTQKDFFETILDKNSITNDIQVNIIEEIFSNFIRI